MRVGLIGDFSIHDEARGIISSNLYRELSKLCEVYDIDVRKLFSSESLKKLKLDLDIVCYIPGASTLSFLITRGAKILSRKSKTVMLSTLLGFHGFSHGIYYGLSSLTKGLIPFIKTDLVLVQSEDAEKLFRELGCNVKFFVSSGVDLERFHPVSESEKSKLREKYGIDVERFVVLHVGSIRRWRNVEVLKDIQDIPDTQLLLIGRTSTRFEQDVASLLEKKGCMIINDFLPRIEEVYALSDCYVFPTMDPVGSIDIPLSVLEAMATNLPVVSTRFGGLPRIFEDGNGVVYVHSVSDIVGEIKDLRKMRDEVKTRELVSPYSWTKIADELMRVYRELNHQR